MAMKLRDWSVPLVLFTVTVIAVGLFLPRLGFYMDDWRVMVQLARRAAPAWQNFSHMMPAPIPPGCTMA